MGPTMLRPEGPRAPPKPFSPFLPDTPLARFGGVSIGSLASKLKPHKVPSPVKWCMRIEDWGVKMTGSEDEGCGCPGFQDEDGGLPVRGQSLYLAPAPPWGPLGP